MVGFHFLIFVLTSVALSAACSKSAEDAGKGASKTDDMGSAEAGVDGLGEEEGEDDPVDVPSNVAGAFLTCVPGEMAPASGGKVSSGKVSIGCSVLEASGSRLDMSSFAEETWEFYDQSNTRWDMNFNPAPATDTYMSFEVPTNMADGSRVEVHLANEGWKKSLKATIEYETADPSGAGSSFEYPDPGAEKTMTMTDGYSLGEGGEPVECSSGVAGGSKILVPIEVTSEGVPIQIQFRGMCGIDTADPKVTLINPNGVDVHVFHIQPGWSEAFLKQMRLAGGAYTLEIDSSGDSFHLGEVEIKGPSLEVGPVEYR